jgi:hypothetical protein
VSEPQFADLPRPPGIAPAPTVNSFGAHLAHKQR